MPAHTYETPAPEARTAAASSPAGPPLPMERTHLHCAHCGWPLLQLGDPVTHYTGDEYDPNSPVGNRGTWIEIPAKCEECGRVTALVVAFHKGEIRVEPLRRSLHLVFRVEAAPHRDSEDPIRRMERTLDRIDAQVGHLAEKVEGHDAALLRVESGLREVLDNLAAVRQRIEDGDAR